MEWSINPQRTCARDLVLTLSVSQSVIHSKMDLDDDSPSTFKSDIKLKYLDYLGPFNMLFLKVLRLFSTKSKLNLDHANVALYEPPPLLHSIM